MFVVYCVWDTLVGTGWEVTKREAVLLKDKENLATDSEWSNK